MRTKILTYIYLEHSVGVFYSFEIDKYHSIPIDSDRLCNHFGDSCFRTKSF